MKKVLFFIVITLFFISCKTTYVSSISGLENNAYIKVVKANNSDQYKKEPLILIIDGQNFQLAKIYQDKKSMKASSTLTTPGKHQVVIKEGEIVLFDKSLFIDNRETRKIILK